MKNLGKRLPALILVMVMLFSMAANVLATGGGEFSLLVLTENEIVIEPVNIPYTDGQTIKQALLATSHTFTGIETDFVYAINGVVDNYRIFYDGGEFDLNAPATAATALCYTPSETLYSEDVIALIIALADLNFAELGERNHPEVKAAYEAALEALRTLAEPDAELLLLDLEEARENYRDMLAGDHYTVTFNITQLGAPFTAAQIILTDVFGNVFTEAGTTIDVIPGAYTYVVSDGVCNRTEGSVTVTDADVAVNIEIPGGNWFASVDILTKSNGTDAYRKEITGVNQATYYLPDTVAPTGATYLYAVSGADIIVLGSTQLRTMYVGVTGSDTSGTTRNWNSRATSLAQLLNTGMEGRTFDIIARYTQGGYTMIQSYEMTIVRVPSIKSLQVSGDGTVLPIAFAADTLEYAVTTTSDEFVVNPAAFGSYSEGYSVSVNGTAIAEGATHTVPLTSDILEDDKYIIDVTVTHANGEAQTYIIKADKVASVSIRLNFVSGVSMTVKNAANSEIAAVSGDATHSIFNLVPGESYTYIASIDGCYFAEMAFTASSGQILTTTTPIATDWLGVLDVAYNTSAANKYTMAYLPTVPFSPSLHEYTYHASDSSTTFAIWATRAANAPAGTIRVLYNNVSTGAPLTSNITSGNAAGISPLNLIANGGYGNRAVIRLEQTAKVDGATCYQEYVINVERVLHLLDMTVSVNGSTVAMQQEANTTKTIFDKDIFEYSIEVPRAATQADLRVRFPNATTANVAGGYTAEIVSVSGSRTIDFSNDYIAVSVSLDTTLAEEVVTVTVRHVDTGAITMVYTLNITKLAPVVITIDASPLDTIVGITEALTGKKIWPESDGTYSLLIGYQYNYTAVCHGYVAASGSFVADSDKTVTVSLTAATVNPAIIPGIESEWPNFRGNSNNNAVVDAPIPTVDEDAVLYWANKLGEGYSAGAVGSPIIVDGYLYTYAGSTIFKVNTITGKIEDTGVMARSSSFSITPPTYAEGLVFIALGNGGIQAFNADTLDSVWLYNDPLRGQPNTPITYCDGYIYTGFWNSETANANFVCLSVTDEDINDTMEAKIPAWTHTQAGGFYWAGAYVCSDFVLVGTDDADSGYTTGNGSLISLDPKSGKPLDSLTMTGVGDVRSSVAYDPVTDAYYFTSKGGDFYSVQMNSNGTIKAGSFKSLHLNNGSENSSTPPMSTSTPVVHNGRAYIGVSGTGQFGAYSGHNITVIDLGSWTIAYKVWTQGYPQTSGLLTTAYDEGDGTAYVYFFDNYTPGKLRVISDKPGQTEPAEITEERYNSLGTMIDVETAYVLFTPFGVHAQYAICSPIVDEYGTIYFKNDSAYLMALGSTIESLTVTTPPNKLSYELDEVFNPAGMTVLVTYTNGKTRDVTQYVSYSKAPLTTDDTKFEITFDFVLYQNKDGAAGVTYTAPSATVNLTVGGVGGGDSELSETEVELVAGSLALSETTLTVSGTETGIVWTSSNDSVATVDANGVVTAIGAGKAVITASVGGEALECAVTVYIPGDMNKDGSVALTDIMLLSNLIKSEGATDPLTLALADVLVNGSVNLQDLMRLYEVMKLG